MTEAYHLNALAPGATLQEYEILRVLGAGSFGLVYLAKGKFLDDLVAIKEYLPRELAMRAEGSSVTPTSSADETNFQWGRQKFLEEARLLWQLAKPQPHPNVIAVRRFFELHDTAYMVMDYEQGEPLSARLESAGRLAEREVWSLLHPLLNGLEMIHEAGVTHRDIKPGNIFVRADGSPVLLDFGAARLALVERTQSAFNAMSPAYAATEQLMGSDKVGPWTDIYGLGATLYRAVTGQLPQSPLERLVEERHRSAVELAGDRYSRTLLAGIDAALALRAEDRPQSIAEWRIILLGRPAEAEEGTAIVSKAATAGSRPAPPPPRGGTSKPGAGRGGYRVLATAALALLIGAAGIGLGAHYLGGQPEESNGKADGEVADAGPSPEQAPPALQETLQQNKQDEARRLAEIEAKRSAEAEAKRAAEAEARRLAEREAERKAEEERRRLAEAEARRLAELKAKRRAEEDAKRQAEAEARRLAEAETARQAEEARRVAEEEARREAEEVRRQAEEEARRQAEEARRLAAEEAQRVAEEARRQAEDEARRQAEEASIAKAEETDRRLSQVVAVEESLFAEKSANVRSAPSADSGKLATLPAGSEVQVTGKLQDGTWYRVDLADGTGGFVWAPLLTREPPPATPGSTAETAQAARGPDALPPTAGGDANSATAGGGAATQASGAETRKAQEAEVRPVPDPAETQSRITELQTYIDQNWRDAERAFRDFAERERMFGHAERFRRVISFDDISYQPPEYVISVQYAYCYMQVRCQNLIGAGAFAARFDDGKLTFLGESGSATN